MENQTTNLTKTEKRTWNKNKLIGQKSPLTPPQVWAIRVRLQLADHKRDLAMFNLALDSKLRGCDLMGLRVSDIQTGDKRATILGLELRSYKRKPENQFSLKLRNIRGKL
jgi:integrase